MPRFRKYLEGTLCLEPGCLSPAEKRSRCQKHYQLYYDAQQKSQPCRVCGKVGLLKTGLCNRHYRLMRVGQWDELPAELHTPRPKCHEPGCERFVHAREFCKKHYEKYFRRYNRVRDAQRKAQQRAKLKAQAAA